MDPTGGSSSSAFELKSEDDLTCVFIDVVTVDPPVPSVDLMVFARAQAYVRERAAVQDGPRFAMPGPRSGACSVASHEMPENAPENAPETEGPPPSSRMTALYADAMPASLLADELPTTRNTPIPSSAYAPTVPVQAVPPATLPTPVPSPLLGLAALPSPLLLTTDERSALAAAKRAEVIEAPIEKTVRMAIPSERSARLASTMPDARRRARKHREELSEHDLRGAVRGAGVLGLANGILGSAPLFFCGFVAAFFGVAALVMSPRVGPRIVETAHSMAHTLGIYHHPHV